MKTSFIRLLSLLLAAIPMTAAAQNNIKSAFNDIIKCPEAQITETHSLEKDPITGVKAGQSDVYRFVLPANKENLIKKVFSAFDKDSDSAYSINRGKNEKNDRQINLAVGNGDGDGVRINNSGYDYIYSLFLAPASEDSDGIYRYAYGINYKKDGGKLIGKLVITYATTLNYRQQMAQKKQYNVLRNLSNGSYVITGSQKSWFDTLMSYFQSMTSANSQTRIALATKAYNVIRDTSKYPDVTETDKDAIREILKGMISDKKYSETVLNKLLSQCLVSIK